ncbi:hypothetical protein E5Q_05056 [Mixia osmundae IAM 14324]|uniref:Phosphatidate cytidylyltransferase n=1 Tax=Mixia osmundae (strain CBS 9802 / IAM 14324 / JCM 22182 / KY 12970) TaxID=764103 RepID=G7E6B0_MIXOS|nr:hypothetical protein E5Q_05056 [Mixia osmundae IAM 14324]
MPVKRAGKANGSASHAPASAYTNGHEHKQPSGLVAAQDEESDSSKSPLRRSTRGKSAATTESESDTATQLPNGSGNGLTNKSTPAAKRAKKIIKRSTTTEGDSTFAQLKAWSDRWEVPRKILHTSIGFYALYCWGTDIAVTALVRYQSVALIIIASAELLRHNNAPFEAFYESVLGFLMRESEKKGVNGVVYYLVGVITVLSLLPTDIAVLSVVILSWCDTAASITGKNFGSYTPRLTSISRFFAPKKSLAGFIGAAATGAFCAWAFWTSAATWGPHSSTSWLHNTTPRLVDFSGVKTQRPWAHIPRLPSPRSTVSLPVLMSASALISAVAESVYVFGLDDNLALPLLSGFGIWAFMYTMG